MLFDTALFVWFFVAVFTGFWFVARFPVVRVVWLLAASYLFYASWNPTLVGLIIASTMADYWIAKKIYQADNQRSRKRWLVLSLATNLGVLAGFKYTGFFLESFNDAMRMMGDTGQLPVPQIILPVGISFYTFQTLSYTIDVYRGKLRASDNPLHFALFVAFFPQLVAGPIVRAADFLPQLLRDPVFKPREHSLGLFLICSGLFKKVALADTLSVNLVDRVWDNPELYSSLEILVGMHAYAFQIYCDFSGYSDIAIGLALLLGLKLPENFNRPYLSKDIAEFWRRWHISLSSWLRDYLYIPLGGNRGGSWATYRNLAITMLLGGLWHGASWNFVLWGAAHGVALAVVRFIQRRKPKSGPTERSRWRVLLAWFVTFEFVNLTWVLFRAPTFSDATRFLGRLTEFSTYTPNLTTPVLLALAGASLLHFTPPRYRTQLAERFIALPAWAQGVLVVGVAITLQHLKGTDAVPFIYFQF